MGSCDIASLKCPGIAELYRTGCDPFSSHCITSPDFPNWGHLVRIRPSNLLMNGLEEVERDRIVGALEASNWIVGGRNGAVERLGRKRTSLAYRMQKLRICCLVSG